MSLRPPCCPNKDCPNHTKEQKPAHWYTKDGTYDTLSFGTIQRYKCSSCGKRFSERTFHIDYYAKRKINYRRIFRQLISTGSTRDIARELGISCASVANRISRLARNAIAVLEELKPNHRVKAYMEHRVDERGETLIVNQLVYKPKATKDDMLKIIEPQCEGDGAGDIDPEDIGDNTAVYATA